APFLGLLLHKISNFPYESTLESSRPSQYQANHNLFTEWNACFTHNQTNNTLIAQHCEEQINTLQQQYNTKLVKENERPTSLVSRHSKRQCKKCNRKKILYDKNSDQCRNCFKVTLRVLSGNKKLRESFV
ncbi:7318_t:CDS:2, partial [Gigaspora rosea]